MGATLPHADGIDVTNRFVLDYARANGGRILDYGCGAGRVVAAGRAMGLDIYGTDMFYGGSGTRADAARSGLLGEAIREMHGTAIPFPNDYFDLVTNNQVMEHVDDLEGTLAEIHRVLKPGGIVLSIFPSRDVWREGHIGIPFSHRLPRGSRIRFLYTWLIRSLGFGTWREEAPTTRRWAVEKLEWIDRWTRYRTRAEIFATYERYFRSELREADYIRYRLRDSPSPLRNALAAWMNFAPFATPALALFRKLAFLVIVSRKAAA
jgi:SAM-dependent methyltransferase